MANIQILGLKNKAGSLKDAYDTVLQHDNDKELDFKYDEIALQAAEREEIKLKVVKNGGHHTRIHS